MLRSKLHTARIRFGIEEVEEDNVGSVGGLSKVKVYKGHLEE
jgi:hypothetical protein